MKKIYKIVFLVLAANLMINLSSCQLLNGDDDDSSDSSTASSTTSTTETTTAATSSDSLLCILWNDSNAPSYIAADSSGNMNVGWKDYNNTLDGSAVDTTSRNAAAGTINSDVYTSEYSTRDLILNRVYNTSSSAYEAASSTWDLTSLASEFGAD